MFSAFTGVFWSAQRKGWDINSAITEPVARILFIKSLLTDETHRSISQTPRTTTR